MVRRLFALLVLVVAASVASACTDPTAPKADCAVISGGSTCSAR